MRHFTIDDLSTGETVADDLLDGIVGGLPIVDDSGYLSSSLAGGGWDPIKV